MNGYRTMMLTVLAAALVSPLASAQSQTTNDSMRMRLRAMDTDNDGVVTRAEWRGSDQAFREQDTNGDGVLSGEEVQGRAGQAVRSERQSRADQSAQLRAMDTDNDGVVTRAEWRGTDQAFREQDTNGDGVLSGDEVRVRASQTPATPDRNRRGQMIARFERADRNRDGRLLRDEWAGDDASFNRMDQDRDMVITFDEFSAVVADRATGTAGRATAETTTRAYQAGYDKGLLEGRDAGRADKGVNGGTWDLDGQRELEQADSGYRQELGARADYQAGYRAGFRVGYREGFGPRR
jgi:Ca2+-binding EF-hand superfamily protein